MANDSDLLSHIMGGIHLLAMQATSRVRCLRSEDPFQAWMLHHVQGIWMPLSATAPAVLWVQVPALGGTSTPTEGSDSSSDCGDRRSRDAIWEQRELLPSSFKTGTFQSAGKPFQTRGEQCRAVRQTGAAAATPSSHRRSLLDGAPECAENTWKLFSLSGGMHSLRWRDAEERRRGATTDPLWWTHPPLGKSPSIRSPETRL
eukprot:351491-Chlamydomonas_euryale.AAC.23